MQDSRNHPSLSIEVLYLYFEIDVGAAVIPCHVRRQKLYMFPRLAVPTFIVQANSRLIIV
jgi:hypothetical protein